VITELTVRLYGIPEQAVALRISFPTVEAACRAGAAAVAAGSGLTRLELLDEAAISAVNAHFGCNLPAKPCLFVEAAGPQASVEADLALMETLAEEEGAIEIVSERSAEGRARLWQARHGYGYARRAARPGLGVRSTDVCVPVSQLAGAMAAARRQAERLGLDAAIAAHVGDGNFHVNVALDPEDAAARAAFEELCELLVDDALARGGTCTGEHGIGLGKLAALAREHGDLLPYMRGIKALFDPHGIMNPGKVLPPGPHGEDAGRPPA
jgi:D-lactate dehydrogenase (cytochrome)